jgi:Fic family protein
MSFIPCFTITNSMTTGLTRIERARGFLDAAHLSDEWIQSMGRRALLLEAHHTTHIEGTQLTLAQAERLLAGESVPEAAPDDVRELLNYRTAFEFVSDYLDSDVSRGRVYDFSKLAGMRLSWRTMLSSRQFRTIVDPTPNWASRINKRRPHS